MTHTVRRQAAVGVLVLFLLAFLSNRVGASYDFVQIYTHLPGGHHPLKRWYRSPDPFPPFPLRTDCSGGVEAPSSRTKGYGRGRRLDSILNGVDDASTLSPGEEEVRQLGSRHGRVYTPPEADNCAECNRCKELVQLGLEDSVGTRCRKACKKCPYAVTLGAEGTVLIELDGITATQYVHDVVAMGQDRRALQGGLVPSNGANVTEVHYATVIFQGKAVNITCSDLPPGRSHGLWLPLPSK